MRYFVGWGALLEHCFDQICALTGGPPDAICDNDTSKHGRALFGVPCLSVEAAARNVEASFVITVRDCSPIASQLWSLGVRDVRTLTFERAYFAVTGIASVSDRSSALRPFPRSFFAGRSVMVTGASRGLGAAVAERLAGMGADLVLHARRSEHLERVASTCAALGAKVTCLTADFASRAELTAVLRVLDRPGAASVDILFNNAAISSAPPASPFDVAFDDLERSFRVNALAPIMLANTVLPAMLHRSFGRVVNVTTALHHQPGSAAYTTSKAALDKYVFELAPHLAGRGVAVALVDPGALRSDMNPTATHGVESALNGLLVAAVDPLANGRWITAQDYAGDTLDGAYSRSYAKLRDGWRAADERSVSL